MTGRPRPRHRKPGSSPYRLFTLAALVAGGVVAVALQLALGANWLLAYLSGVNVATFVLYAYDKSASARGGWTRVPERVLHYFALAGGTPAALLSQLLLRHKTLKRPFHTWFIAICVVQLLALAAWAYGRHGGGVRW